MPARSIRPMTPGRSLVLVVVAGGALVARTLARQAGLPGARRRLMAGAGRLVIRPHAMNRCPSGPMNRQAGSTSRARLRFATAGRAPSWCRRPPDQIWTSPGKRQMRVRRLPSLAVVAGCLGNARTPRAWPGVHRPRSGQRPPGSQGRDRRLSRGPPSRQFRIRVLAVRVLAVRAGGRAEGRPMTGLRQRLKASGRLAAGQRRRSRRPGNRLLTGRTQEPELRKGRPLPRPRLTWRRAGHRPAAGLRQGRGERVRSGSSSACPGSCCAPYLGCRAGS